MSYLLPRLIGTGAAFDVMLTGRSVDSAEALQMGIVSRVVPDDGLIKTALEIARTIAAHSPFALEMTKRVVWSNVDAPSFEAAIELENRTQVMTGMTEDLPRGHARICRETRAGIPRERLRVAAHTPLAITWSALANSQTATLCRLSPVCAGAWPASARALVPSSRIPSL